MLALRIEYLTGRNVATAYNDRSAVEWPPHPARVFFALVSTWAEAEAPDEGERAALDWLARQAPPALAVPPAGNSGRTPVTHYVPVNDTAVLSREFVAAETKVAEARAALEAASLVVGNGEGDGHTAERTRAKAEEKFRRAEERLAAAKLADQSDRADITGTSTRRAAALLPDRRGRQPRTFPSLSLSEPVVHLIWPADVPSQVLSSLAQLAQRVTRIGHSSSLVACRLVDAQPKPTLIPSNLGSLMLRVPDAGLVDRLIEAHIRHRQIEPRVMPCAFAAYASPAELQTPAPPASIFGDDWLVFRQVEGPSLSLTLASEIGATMRSALMSHADQPVDPVICGHEMDGTPAQVPHAAFVPLPFVGHEQADGHVLGLAIVLPRELKAESRQAVMRAVGRWEARTRADLEEPDVDAPPLEVRFGARGVIRLERVVWGFAPLRNLQPNTWSRPATRWVSVTPVALDRNPGDLHSSDVATSEKAFGEAEAAVAAGCERIGLPRPVRVEILPSVTMAGTAKARAHVPFPANAARTQRAKAHAYLEFAKPVRGPILLGAGRYVGLGLFRPVDPDVPGRLS